MTDASGSEHTEHAALSRRWRAVPDYDTELDDVAPDDDASVYYTHPAFGEVMIFEGEYQLMKHIVNLHNAPLSHPASDA
jgi:hypothetical protein